MHIHTTYASFHVSFRILGRPEDPNLQQCCGGHRNNINGDDILQLTSWPGYVSIEISARSPAWSVSESRKLAISTEIKLKIYFLKNVSRSYQLEFITSLNDDDDVRSDWAIQFQDPLRPESGRSSSTVGFVDLLIKQVTLIVC